MNATKWLIEVFFDGFRWAAYFGGNFLGMFATEREASDKAFSAKWAEYEKLDSSNSRPFTNWRR